MKTKAELIEELREKASEENDRHGIQCVKNMLTWYDRGDEKSAAQIRRIEADKTQMYPEIESLLRKIFGCQAHLKVNCNDRWCQID